MSFPKDSWPPLYLSRVRIGTLSTPLVNTLQPSMSRNSVEWLVRRDHSTCDFPSTCLQKHQDLTALQNPTLTFFFPSRPHPVSHSGVRTDPLPKHIYTLQREYFRPPEVCYTIVARISTCSHRGQDTISMSDMSRQAACRSRSSVFWAPDENIFVSYYFRREQCEIYRVLF